MLPDNHEVAAVSAWRRSGIAFAVLLLGYVSLLAVFSHASFPVRMTGNGHWPYLMDKPVGEDGYYMLTVAENIAQHGRIMYNGKMEATGIQPLSTLVFAGLDWVVQRAGGGRLDFVRSVLVLGGVLLVCFAAQMASLTGRLVTHERAAAAAALAFLLTVSDYTLFRLFTYGLETGFYLILLTLCVQVTWRMAARGGASTREAVVLGIAAGLADATRIDFGVIFLCVLATLLWKRWIDWPRAVLAGAIALIIVAPWFLFVHRVDGAWLPSSGRAESTLVTLGTLPPRALRMALAVLGHLVPWSYAGMAVAPTIAGIASVGLIVWLSRRRGDWLKNDLEGVRSQAVLWLPAFLGLITVYVIFFNATHFYYRYSAILVVLAIPAMSALLAASPRVRAHAMAVPAVLLVCFCAWTFGALHTGKIGNSQTIVAGYVQQHYPEARVGQFQSGVVGFFNPNVENLDGKLNRPALEAEEVGRLPEFLDQQRVDVITDWGSLIKAYLPSDYLHANFEPCPVPMSGSQSVCLIRRSFAAKPDLQ